jgi:hypothetical protein
MPRFVILEHDHPHQHWDLMLEAGEVLRTWRLSALPCPGPSFAVEPSFDHRRAYLEYEGPISGDRGCVIRRESGTFASEVEENGLLVLHLDGERLRGSLRLERGENGTWRGRFTEDREATT